MRYSTQTYPHHSEVATIVIMAYLRSVRMVDGVALPYIRPWDVYMVERQISNLQDQRGTRRERIKVAQLLSSRISRIAVTNMAATPAFRERLPEGSRFELIYDEFMSLWPEARRHSNVVWTKRFAEKLNRVVSRYGDEGTAVRELYTYMMYDTLAYLKIFIKDK